MPRQPSKPGEQAKGGSSYKPVHTWTAAPGEGWQHGDVPEPPEALHSDTLDAWQSWFAAWWAAHWTPADLAGIRLVASLYDNVMHGDGKATELTTLMDKHGMTPYGRKQLLWLPPSDEDDEEEPAVPDDLAAKRESRGKKLA